MPNINRAQPDRCACHSWHRALLGLFAAALLVAGQFLSLDAVVAHEGHDHDKPAPLNLPVAPRVVAVTPDYELVGVLSGEQRLTIFLHHFVSLDQPQANQEFISRWLAYAAMSQDYRMQVSD